MDRQQFLREVESIKTSQQAHTDSDACSRLYNALAECLTTESKSVEAKLDVLTAALLYYTDLRSMQDPTSSEADRLGHFLFRECSRVVLGIEFHHLPNEDPYKMSLKDAIVSAHERLGNYGISSVFRVLDWLLVNQWSHPTLVAMMRGEEVERECALAYINTGEYPELLRLRIQMLMESGCEGYSLNLISWCIQSPVFELDIAMRATHLLLLHRLGRSEDFLKECCQLRCCVARDLLRHMLSRGSVEDQMFLLLLSRNFLLVNWMKPAQSCCLQELLEFWLQVQRRIEPDAVHFVESLQKITSVTHDLKQICMLLDVIVSLFGTEFIGFCSELSKTVFQQELARVCCHVKEHGLSMRCCHSDDVERDTAVSLAHICLVLGRLYDQHPTMHLACMLTAFSLNPTDVQYFVIENVFHAQQCVPNAHAVPPVSISCQLYAALLEELYRLRLPELDPLASWDDRVRIAALKRLEQFGVNYDEMSNTFIVTDKFVPGFETLSNPGMAESKYMTGGDPGMQHESSHTSTYALNDIHQILTTARDVGCFESGVDEKTLTEITAYQQAEIAAGKVSHMNQNVAQMSGVQYGAGSANVNHTSDSGDVVRFVPSTIATTAGTNSPTVGPLTDSGGTILVTESNLPYLKQFLPNLQTLMQSVQNLVGAAPPSSTDGPSGDSCLLNSYQLAAARSLMSAPTGSKKENRNSSRKQNQDALINAQKADSVVDTVASDADIKSKTMGFMSNVKIEPDSAENGYTCNLCACNFSTLLDLSIHNQQVHGARCRSNYPGLNLDSVAGTDSMVTASLSSSTVLSHEASAKSCVAKMTSNGDENSVSCADGTVVSGDASDASSFLSSGPAPFMCDACGDLVRGLEAHANVCIGRQSPVKKRVSNAGIECKTSSVVGAEHGVPMYEVLQLAEQFLRQHAPKVSTAGETRQTLVPSPPPYQKKTESFASKCSTSPAVSDSVKKSAQVVDEAKAVEAALLQDCDAMLPPGKQIIYEGTRMQEFIEYQCESCLLTFASSVSANAHVANHHTSASVSAYHVYACMSCSLRYRDPRIMRHHVVYLCTGSQSQWMCRQVQSRLLYPCLLCSKTFISPEYIALHNRSHHCVTTSSLKCVLPAPPGATSVPTLNQLINYQQQPNMSVVTANRGHLLRSAAEGELDLNHHLVREAAANQTALGSQGQITEKMPPFLLNMSSGKDPSIQPHKTEQLQHDAHEEDKSKTCKNHPHDCGCGCRQLLSPAFQQQEHVSVGTSNQGRYQCTLCGQIYFDQSALIDHMIQTHQHSKSQGMQNDVAHTLSLSGDNRQEFTGDMSLQMLSPSSGFCSASSATFTRQSGEQIIFEASNVVQPNKKDAKGDPDPLQQNSAMSPLQAGVDNQQQNPSLEDGVRPKRSRKSRNSEFFVMMFRNYPILAKGVSMCRSCGIQLEPTATTESHADLCTGAQPADVRRSTLFRCTHCPASFWRAKDCRVHQLESCLPAHGIKVERLTEPSVACPMCDVRSYNRSGLMSHMKFRHALNTDGVRQVMNRCGIRKSVPPSASDVASCGVSAFDDGSHSFEDLPMLSVSSGDAATPLECTPTMNSTSAESNFEADDQTHSVEDAASAML